MEGGLDQACNIGGGGLEYPGRLSLIAFTYRSDRGMRKMSKNWSDVFAELLGPQNNKTLEKISGKYQ